MKKLKGKDNIKVGNHPLTNMISKLASMRRGEDKCKTIKMHLTLRDQQPETILHICDWLYQNIAEMTNQKTIMDTYIKKKKQSKHNVKMVRESREDKRREENKNPK